MLSLATNYIFPERRVDNKVLHSCTFNKGSLAPLEAIVIKSHSLLCRHLKLDMVCFLSYLSIIFTIYRSIY